MFVVRTRLTSLGTPHARDALARFKVMARDGLEPTVVTVSGKTLHADGLERWIASLPRPVRPSF